MIQIKSGIVLNERVTENCWRITLEASRIGSEIRPGQFINVKIGKTNDPLFRRPFSIFRVVKLDRNALGIEVVYKVVGRGTRLMTNLKQGDELDIIGPLGHGFEQFHNKSVHVLIGGGTGCACLLMLGQEISRVASKPETELYILLGAKTERALLLEEEFKKLNGKVLVSTDDGSYGYSGYVTGLLTDAIKKGVISPDCGVYASGPEPMLRALAPICKTYNIPAQVSLERHMMCGFGGCFVCVCKIDKSSALKYRDLRSSHIQFNPEGQFGYGLVCKDGPVFNIEEVLFDE